MKFKLIVCILCIILILPYAVFADYIDSAVEVREQMTDRLAFYIDCPHYVTQNGKIAMQYTPFEEDGKYYVPLTEFAQTYATQKSQSGSDVKLKFGSQYITIKSQYIKVKDGVQYISTDYIASCAIGTNIGISVYQDGTGLALFDKKDINLSWSNDRSFLSGLIGEIIFDAPSGTKIISNVTEKHPNFGHPRIFGTEEDFTRIQNEIADGLIKAEWFYEIRDYTETFFKSPYVDEAGKSVTITYGTTDGIRMRHQSGTFAAIVENCSFMYKITGEERYANRAWDEIEALMSWVDWNPYHLIDTGQFMSGMSVGYDWLYDWLSDSQKASMRANIIAKGLTPIRDVYDGKYVQSSWSVGRSFPDWWTVSDNWTLVCSSGAVMAALAICDEDTSGICEDILQRGLKSLLYGLSAYAPAGAWFEGASYWQLATETAVEALSSLEAAVGTDYGLSNTPGVSKTGYYPYSMIGRYSFNFAFAGEKIPSQFDGKELFWLSEKYNAPELESLIYGIMLENDISANFRLMFYCKGEPEITQFGLENDYYYPLTEAAVMCDSRDADTEFFAGIHAGNNDIGNCHFDIGSFVIDSFGNRFVSDLGYEDYNLPGRKYDKYRNRAEGHNTLVFNPASRQNSAAGENHDQVKGAFAKIDRYEHNSLSALAITDMTPAYSPDVSSAVRGMKMTDGRTRILVQDEIRNTAPYEMYWFMHTKADIEVSGDKKSAMLSIGDNKLEVRILEGDGAEFAVMGAVPLPESPTVPNQNTNEGYQKLYIHLNGITNYNLCVSFTPEAYIGKYQYPDIVPIDEWELDEPEDKPAVSKLSSIKVNGITIPGFNRDKFFYTYKLSDDAAGYPEVSASGGRVIYPDTFPGIVKVETDIGENVNTYGILFEKDDYNKNTFSKALSKDTQVTLYIYLINLDNKLLEKVKVKKITLDEVTTLEDYIDVPDNGAKYELGALFWHNGTMMPILKQVLNYERRL